jgi:hypothetical protein
VYEHESSPMTDKTMKVRNDRRAAKNAAAGLKVFTAWAPRAQHAELRTLVEKLRADPTLRLVSFALQSEKTGRMRGVKLR